MPDHEPCARLQLVENETSHLSEKIDNLHEDVKSYMGTVGAGQNNISQLLRTNVDEQKEIRADVLKSNEFLKLQIDHILKTSDERQRAIELDREEKQKELDKYKEDQKEIQRKYEKNMILNEKKTWGIMIFILAMCLGTVWSVGTVKANGSADKADTVMTRK